MPLKPGKKNVGRNIKTELAAGKSQAQATAIALRKSREDNVKERLAEGDRKERTDGWFNAMTGIGTANDRTAYTQFQPDPPLNPFVAGEMFAHDDIVRIIVETWPEEMLREGWTVKGPPPDVCEFLDAECERLNVHAHLQDALTWGALFGGNLLWIGTDDMRPVDQPRGPFTKIAWLENIDRRYANPKAGDSLLYPTTWELYPIETVTSRDVRCFVHGSRVIRFGGAKTEDLARLTLNGWDYSVLQAIQKPLASFHNVFNSADVMMSDASTAVLKIKGLIAALSGKRSQEMRDRAALLNITRSIARILMLDADPQYNEEFKKEATSFTGVADILVQAAKRISASTRIPVPILMGEAPAGLNATGEATIRMFYDRVNTKRKRMLAPALLRILRIMAKGFGYSGPLSVEFPSLWQESPQENALRRKTVAETDQIYATIQVLSPETIAENRFRPSGWSPETELKGDEREFTPPPVLAPKAPPGPAKAPPGPAKAPPGPAKPAKPPQK